MTKAAIKIETGSGGGTVITVDGERLKYVTACDVSYVGPALPTVTVTMFARGSELNIESGELKIGGVGLPESVQKALFDYLAEKFLVKGKA